MTDNWDSESGQTKFLDENGNLVGGIETWDDSQKLQYIKGALMLWCSELDTDVMALEKDKTPGLLREGYKSGKRIQIRETQEKIRCLLYQVFGDNNNQTGGIIND